MEIEKSRLRITQKTINFDITDLNLPGIIDIIYENTRDIIALKQLEKKGLKIWSIFEFFVVKNEGKIDQEVFPAYFCTETELFIGNYRDTVRSWAIFALNSLDEWLGREGGVKFLKFTKLDTFLVEFEEDIIEQFIER